MATKQSPAHGILGPSPARSLDVSDDFVWFGLKEARRRGRALTRDGAAADLVALVRI